MLSLGQYGGISESPQHLAHDSTGSVYNGKQWNQSACDYAVLRFVELVAKLFR